MREQPLDDADSVARIVDEVESGEGPVAFVRPGHRPVVLVSAEQWQRLDELACQEATAWWRRDAAERAAQGEAPGDGEIGPGLDESAFRQQFSHLFRHPGAA